MFCPKCGNNNREGAKFCARCGFDLSTSEQDTDSRMESHDSTFDHAYETVQEKKSGRKTILILVIVIAAIVAAALAAILLYKNHSKKTAEEQLQEEINTAIDELGGSMEEAEEELNDLFDAAEEDAEQENAKDETSSAEDAEDGKNGSGSNSGSGSSSNSSTNNSSASGNAGSGSVSDTAPATASLVDIGTINTSSMTKATVTNAYATSVLQIDGFNYDPVNVFDGDQVTSWQENDSAYGEGEYIDAILSRSYEISYITLKLGNWRDDTNYKENSVPKTLTIWLDDYSFQMTFPHEKKEFCVALSKPVKASEIYIVMDEVYHGDDYSDTAIADIAFYEKK